MKLILVRHGETKWNHENRVVGHTGMALNNNGRKQAGRLAQALKDEEVSCIYSSPLRRARETAAAIARAQGLHVVNVDALKEVDAGELEGLTFDEVVERYGDFLQEWIKDRHTFFENSWRRVHYRTTGADLAGCATDSKRAP